MKKGLGTAIDAVEKRVENICGFLHDLDKGEPIDAEALRDAVHDCANVTQSMRSLKRLADRIDSGSVAQPK